MNLGLLKSHRTVAVIIVSHNYGRYLSYAIESALAQTIRPLDIIVVDDASADDTREVAMRYAAKGVSYLHGDWKNVGRARNAALAQTKADLLVFLDADDLLHPQYCACGIEALLKKQDAAIAYPDHQCFGNSKEYLRRPETLDWQRFDDSNSMSAVSMVRRDALVQVGGWNESPHQHADWITWRRVLALGWKTVKSKGLHFYRMHDKNMHRSYESGIPYSVRAGFLTEPTTFCLSLSGRTWAWPLTREFLEKQTFPRSLIHLILLDTSHDVAFSREVRSWLAASGYGSTTYLHRTVGRSGIADLPREEVAQEVRDACATIYNVFSRLVQTPLVFLLEDDVVPPLDAFLKLAGSFTYNVLSVSGVYRHRHRDQAVVWDWTKEGKPVDSPNRTGVERSGGSGFGCLVIRGEVLRHSVFRSGPPLYNYDQDFYHDWVFEKGKIALVDWGCVCRHFLSPTQWR